MEYDFKERVRESSDIVEIVSSYIPLKRKGGTYWAQCPFHDEKTASFQVRSDRQRFKCFGCGEGGDIFTFIGKMEMVEFRESLEILANKAGIPMAHSGEDRERERLYGVNEKACRFFEGELQDSDNALEYLKSRGINQESISRFRLGYAPDSWDALINSLSEFSGETLEKVGLVRSREMGGWYDYFRGRVIFPFFTSSGRKIIGFGGRIMDDNRDQPKYLNTPETMIFNKGSTFYGFHLASKSARDKKQLIIVEGYTDVIASHQVGIDNVSATAGTSLTQEHIDVLGRRQDLELVLCFDGDNPGIKAAVKSAEQIMTRPRAKVWILPEQKDPQDLLQEGRDFRKELLTDRPPFEFLVEHYAEDNDLSTLDGKIGLLEKMKLCFLNVPSSRRGVCLETLAMQTGITRDSINDVLYEDKKGETEYAAYKKGIKVLSKSALELQFLQQFVAGFSPDLMAYFRSQGMSEQDFQNSTAKAVYAYLVEQEDPSFLFHGLMPLAAGGKMFSDLVENIVEVANTRGVILTSTGMLKDFLHDIPDGKPNMFDLEFLYLRMKTRGFTNKLPRALERGRPIKELVDIINNADNELTK